MPAMTEAEARAILEKVLKLSKADACEATIGGGSNGNIRFARNTVTTSGENENTGMSIRSSFGKRSGSASLNQFDDATIERAVRRAEELARLAPEDPEYMPPLAPQTYAQTPSYVEATANITPEYRAQLAGDSIAAAKAKGCTAAGFLEGGAGWSARMNSAGLFGYQRSTSVTYTISARTPDGTGSGWAGQSAVDVSRIDGAAAARVAVDKAVASRDARAIEPGKYTVVLEPAASVELIQNLLNVDARSADEGRSFLAKPGGGTRLGEKLMDERVRIYSDPMNPEVPSGRWNGDGRPQQRTVWIEKGAYQNLAYTRYWAEKQGKPALPGPANFIMDGGTESLEDLIRGTARGLLVTRTWYIRSVDPQTLLFTGLTRDGTFYIEDGQIRYAVKNMRFNESPVIMLNNLDALGRPVRVSTDESQPSLVPPMRIRDFNFSSLSDAV
ncbi:MAG: TldD/PmbA family protein [Gemmatimonadales bacterium]|nr:TldD/PmbA family protein [Gemmatimonadales bacterium]